MNFELIYTFILLGVVALGVLLYGVRVAFKGRAQFERVEKQGGSSLLSKDIMQGAYWFFQPMGRLLVFLKITPNQISWASLVLGLTAGICLGWGHFGSAAVFATISAVLDALDGMVARMTGVSSDAGEVLDTTVDRYSEFFFLGGLAVYHREIPILLVIVLLALVGSFMVSYSTAKAEALQIAPPKGNMRRPERALYLILGAALSPVTIPWLESHREFPVAIAHPMVIAVCLIAVLSNLSAIERLWAIAKAIRVREAHEVEARKLAAESALIEEEDEKKVQSREV